mmetsp:Transcript_62928/g.130795  ORF Transcript_62928/g.130795 Transcript_62928/m.130795 type:complete len:242 (+) Transcript_62928:693-1418(+)
MHLHRLALRRHASGRERHRHAGLQDPRLHAAHWHRADAADLVHVLEGQAEGLVGRALGRLHVVERIQQARARVPFLERVSVADGLEEIVSRPPGDRHHRHLLGVIPDLLQVPLHLLGDLLVTILVPGHVLVVHLVEADDELTHAECVGEEGMLARLSVGGDPRFELARRGGHHQDADVRLGGSSDHVLDEVPMPRGVNDGEEVLLRLELPQGDVDGDTTLTLSLELVKHPGVLERTLARFG